MYYDPLYTYSPDMISSSPLPNIHPEDIDCVIRSQNAEKGSLYVSNIEGAQNIITLKKLNVSAILTCSQGYRLDHPQQFIRFYKYHPFVQDRIFDLNRYLEECTQFIKGCLAKTNCIVHCLTGNGKAIFILVAFLIRYYGMNLNDGLLYIKKKRQLIQLNQSQKEGLRQFQIYIKNKQNRVKTKKTQSNPIKYKTHQTDKFLQFQDPKDIKNGLNVVGHSKNKTLLSIPSNSQQRMNSQCSNISNSHSKAHQNYSEITSKQNLNKSKANNFDERSYKLKTEQKSNKMVTERSIRSHEKNEDNENIYGVQHKQPLYFDQIWSSSHQPECIGVKRQLKGMSTSSIKNNSKILPNTQLIIQSTNQLQVPQGTPSKVLSNSKVSAQKSSHLGHKRSYSCSEKDKILTEQSQSRISQISKKSSASNANNIRIFNPEDSPQKMKKGERYADLSTQISPSRKMYFEDINKQLNSNINLILTQYETEMSSLREKYHYRLRNIRVKDSSSKNGFQSANKSFKI